MRTLRPLAALALAASLLPGLGCERSINALTSDPKFRQNVNEKGKASCLQAANAQLKTPASPATAKKLDAYCDCITVKGLSQFSNAELVELGIDKEKLKEPSFQKRLGDAAKTCSADVFHD